MCSEIALGFRQFVWYIKMASLVGQVRLTHPVCRDARSLYEARWCLPDWYQNGDGRKEQRDKEGQRDREAAKREGRNALRSTLEFGNTLNFRFSLFPCLFLPIHLFNFFFPSDPSSIPPLHLLCPVHSPHQGSSEYLPRLALVVRCLLLKVHPSVVPGLLQHGQANPSGYLFRFSSESLGPSVSES